MAENSKTDTTKATGSTGKKSETPATTGSNKSRTPTPPKTTESDDESDEHSETETTTKTTTKPATEPPVSDRQAKMDALKKRTAEKKEKALVEAVNRVALFDSTQASGWETTGTHALGAMKMGPDSIVISGRNIGAEQREPDWTTEQMQVINKARSTILFVQQVTNTRRSVMDANMEYVGRDETGTIVPTEKAYVSTLDPSTYCIGIGPEKYDVTGSPRYYADVVVADINGNWLANQWTSEGIIIEGVAQNVLMQQNRPGNTSGRRIGHHFARIGLPAYAFGPVFNTLGSKYEGCMSQVTSTKGYYWLNASWGVTSFSATFSYRSESGIQNVTNLVDVMRMLNGKSSLCLGTVAISLTCPAKMIDGKPVPDKSSYGLSVKMHNAFGVDVVDFHGPSQQGSTGLTVPARIAQKAKIMGASRATTGTGVGSIFAASGMSAFAQGGAAVPTIKTTETKSYM